MSIDPRALRDAFGAFLTGVTVVTSRNAAGAPIGFTANSFASVSLDPPLLLVCIAKSSRNFEAVTGASGFAVNILSEGQKDVSNTFARPSEDRFATVGWSDGPHGAPVLADVAAWFDCSMHEIVDAGDHAILIGRVEAFGNAGTTGLGYQRGAYFFPGASERALVASQDMPQVIGAVAERDGAILLVEAGEGRLKLPAFALTAEDGPDAFGTRLSELTGLAVQPGLIYSVYDDRKAMRRHVVYRAVLGEGEPVAGRFFPAADLPIDRIADSAERDLVRRYAAESRFGNFGVYVGDQDRGRVHAQPVKEPQR
ncbi:flavin reductase [Ensifer soli]|uniref:flavin reductase n=1 Tax=Ciceribacter sp. sgz301302 TaxID=3342379 RepID=UPI0035BA2102